MCLSCNNSSFSLLRSGFRQLRIFLSPPHNATSCKHNMWCLIQLPMALYVVLYLWTVMRRAGAENSDMMIFSALYTSGKSFIQIKSDPYETGMR
ncbi:hypothetical protein EGY17_00695 (plasmid) [Escherichia coli]|nr:hypothetical protein EGY17_00695 [Escherichia coli]